ncbi:CHAT domain-containing protein [Russula dissimulans]|nr:CHAT domain-containing protein [Russula dissimulans]
MAQRGEGGHYAWTHLESYVVYSLGSASVASLTITMLQLRVALHLGEKCRLFVSSPRTPALYQVERHESSPVLTTSRQEDDLLAAIPLLTESLLFPFSPEAVPVSITIRIFYRLARSLASRFELHRDLRDLEQAVTYYRHILTLPPGDLDSFEAEKARMGAEVELDLAEEIVRILQRMRASTQALHESGGVVLPELPPNSASPKVSLSPLASAHRSVRLFRTCNRAVQQSPRSSGPRTSSTSFFPDIISVVLLHRFHYNKQPEYLEEAIRHSRAALAACPPAHSLRPDCLEHLYKLLSIRDAFFGNAESLEEADACIHDTHSEEIPEHLRTVANMIERSKRFSVNFKRDISLEALEEEIRRKQERLEKIPAGHSDYLNALCSVALDCRSKFERTLKLADLKEAINYFSIALAASPPDHYLRWNILSALSNSCLLHYLFDETAVHYLDYSIMYCRDLLELYPYGHVLPCDSVKRTLAALSKRYFALHRQVDLDESMALFKSASEVEHTDPLTRYMAVAMWASVAQIYRHPSTTLAYEKAMSLIQSLLAVGPTLEIQHRLTGRWSSFMALPLNCASYYIEIGKLESAVEILERGRTLLWSQMRGLRTPIDQLRASGHAMLAEQFVAISEQLENIATSTQASGIYTGTRGGRPLMTTPPTAVLTCSRKRGEIVDQIRLVPGFADFLKAVPFGTLQTAAACGPVIIINHCAFRPDILIILRDSAPVLIPTHGDFFTRAAQLKQLLWETRTKYPLESMRYEHALRFVLQELYKLVGRPVIEKLREQGIPEQSRVWWCPTSIFCSLPLHAMGPIESEDCEMQYFSDLYVSSYTPSLSALIESRKGIVANSERPSLLVVGQPDPTLQGVRGEIKVIQRHAPSASSLIGAKATRASVMEHLPDHQMVHFACHGRLEPEKPFETGFVLHGDERLTLLDIVCLQLSTAEYVDTSDEVLHLTAAMQYCGFRSVVGTLWAMADIAGRDLAGHFYRFMFGEEAEERGMGIGERSARALREAVQMLRRKRGITLERWVNFVHYGG